MMLNVQKQFGRHNKNKKLIRLSLFYVLLQARGKIILVTMTSEHKLVERFLDLSCVQFKATIQF